MNENNEIFISYAWGGKSEDLADQVFALLTEKHYKVIRDKIHLGYKGNIKDFMQRIGRGKAILVIISDKYLRSPNCMYEIVQMQEHKHFFERIFPIVLPDADIYKPQNRLKYVKYWENEVKSLNSSMKDIDNMALIAEIQQELQEYNQILNSMSGISSLLKNTNTLTPEILEAAQYKPLFVEMEKILAADALPLENEKNSVQMPPKQSAYRLKNIYQLLSNAFDEADLEQFCRFNSDFADALHKMGSGQSKQQKLMAFLDFAQRNLLLDKLLHSLQEENPAQFQNFMPYKD